MTLHDLLLRAVALEKVVIYTVISFNCRLSGER